jgi:hypothetical protein
MNDLTQENQPLESIKALLSGAIDYAGLFPPSQLSMADAVVNYAKYRGSEHSWMLGRFVVPVARLDELRETASQFVEAEGRAWQISALAAEDIYDTLKRLTAFNSTNAGGFVVDSLEVKANSVSKIEISVDALPEGLNAYFEIGLGTSNFAELIATLAIDRQQAKIRTGGVTSDEFPRSRDIIRFVRTCLAGNVPFKATAGLHHPIRCYRPLTYAEGGPSGTMHGFLNLFLMTGFARESYKPDTLEELMEEEFGEVFQFTDTGVTWRGENFLSNWQLERLRRLGIQSFGSCSFEEPVEDLKALGLL